MDSNLELMARREDWQGGISVYARHRHQAGKILIAQPLQFEGAPEGSYVEPFVRLQIQEAQQLMDELWQCGLRPSEGTGSAGSLRATEEHLSDMRAIAFKQLGMKR